MKAYLLIRPQPYYRRDAFADGLAAAGHEVSLKMPATLDPGTLLVIWNRYASNADLAARAEAAGGTVLVAENGYIGAGGTSPKWDDDAGTGRYYALGRGFHNDHTRVPAGDGTRWARLGITPAPWRTDPGAILMLPNRSFGVPGRIMPPDWPERAKKAVERVAPGRAGVRHHPGNGKPAVGILAALAGVSGAAVWSSTAGIHALVAGVPVFCAAPYWICKPASVGRVEDLAGALDWAELERRRIEALHRMAWGQWTVEEIGRGVPFGYLLR